jgi:hypothetical protein
MRIRIKAEGRMLYLTEVQSLLRVEALKGHAVVPRPMDGMLDVEIEFGKGDLRDPRLADVLCFRTPATLPTDALDS